MIDPAGPPAPRWHFHPGAGARARVWRRLTPPTPSATADVARAILQNAVPADDTAARAYLAQRGTWPPLGTGPSLPATVRWLAAGRVVDPAELARPRRPPRCA